MIKKNNTEKKLDETKNILSKLLLEYDKLSKELKITKMN